MISARVCASWFERELKTKELRLVETMRIALKNVLSELYPIFAILLKLKEYMDEILLIIIG